MIVADGPVDVTTFSGSSLGVLDITLDVGPGLSGMAAETSETGLLGIAVVWR